MMSDNYHTSFDNNIRNKPMANLIKSVSVPSSDGFFRRFLFAKSTANLLKFSPATPKRRVTSTAASARCPHCGQIFQKPVTLPCGHSLCNTCKEALLERYRYELMNNSNLCSQISYSPSPSRPRIRMGVSSFNFATIPRGSTEFDARNLALIGCEPKNEAKILRQRFILHSSASEIIPTSQLPKNSLMKSQKWKAIDISSPLAHNTFRWSNSRLAIANNTNSKLLNHNINIINSPPCPVCQADASTKKPISNYALEQMLCMICPKAPKLPPKRQSHQSNTNLCQEFKRDSIAFMGPANLSNGLNPMAESISRYSICDEKQNASQIRTRNSSSSSGFEEEHR